MLKIVNIAVLGWVLVRYFTGPSCPVVPWTTPLAAIGAVVVLVGGFVLPFAAAWVRAWASRQG